MLNVSYEFERLLGQNTDVMVKAKLTFANGPALDLVGDDFMRGGVRFKSATSSSSSFDIGAAIIGQCELTLNNYDERFSAYDFTGAKVEPYVGMELSSGSIEWLRKGVFWIEQPSAYPSTIRLTALDNMSLFEKPYNTVTTRYPASLRTIVNDIALKCGVSVYNTTFPNSDYVVEERPDDDALSCLDVISYAAQCAGCWAKVDERGRLVLSWYDPSKLVDEADLDGGVFDEDMPYSSGDAADGGDFFSYSSGANLDGGVFDKSGVAVIHAISSSTIVTDDVVVTGVSVTANDGKAPDGSRLAGDTSLFGEEGYVLSIESNPLILFGKAPEVADRVGRRVVGLRFRPFTVQALGNPCYEAGDPVLIVDARQNVYKSFFTSITYQAGGYESYSCDAETPSRNNAAHYSAMTKTYLKLRDEIDRETTARELAVKALTEALADSNGLFTTVEESENGGSIYYLHDKPTLEDSQYVWKMTSEAIGVSTDGGKTYLHGLTVDGNAILNRIYAVGIDADYITTGALNISKNGKTMFSADMDTGDVYIDADTITIGSQSLASAIDASSVEMAYCATAAGSATKMVTATTGYSPKDGSLMCVRFVSANTASKPVLSVNGGDAVLVYLGMNELQEDFFWGNGAQVLFRYAQGYEWVDVVVNGSTIQRYMEVKRWYVVDSGAHSMIKASSDNILMRVANDYAKLNDLSSYATKSELEMTKESIELSVESNKTWYVSCTTLASIAAKKASCDGFVLSRGVSVTVKFTHHNVCQNPTLNIADTGAYPMYANSVQLSESYSWKEGDTITFVFDGEKWLVGDGASYAGVKIAESSLALKVSKGDVTSQLVMESGKIALSTNRLSWTSDGSQMDEYGNVTFKGEFSVDSKTATDTTKVRVTNGTVQFNKGQSAVGAISSTTNGLDVIANKIDLRGVVSTYNPTFGYTGTGVNGWVNIGGTSVYLVNGLICSVG